MRLVSLIGLKSFFRDLIGKRLNSAVSSGRYPKRAILVANDLLLLNLAMWVAFSIRLGKFYAPPDLRFASLLAIAPVISIFIFFFMDLYRLVTRFIGLRSINQIALALAVSTVIWALSFSLLTSRGLPRTVIILYFVLGTAMVWGSRQLAGWLFREFGIEPSAPFDERKEKVVIFGAGQAGIDLFRALAKSSRYDPVAFVDQNTNLWGQYVGSLRVYRPARLGGLIDGHGVKEVILALPHSRRSERAEILRSLENFPVSVRILPALEDIASGRVIVQSLRPVMASDLLGRDPVPPLPELLSQSIHGKSVMVTGAGGSIGSEIVRQVLLQQPRSVVLFEASERALYEIEQEAAEIIANMRAIASGPAAVIELFPVLGDVKDERVTGDTIQRHAVETIYHAAAYKHVPIVEANPAVGLANNIFGTAVLAQAALKGGVERFVFISTDKAVRPTNVMGASKRLAELYLQSLAANNAGRTIFAIVRFGNVLDSSGSVVRLFRKQIESGGPVTVTHRDVVRFFMSIPEAASLVIQAGTMALGGEVFVLDMGEPVRINDLARSMIKLMGFEVKDENAPSGDITIEYVGLRPGEKLFEELFLGGALSGTFHPRIMASHEPTVSWSQLGKELSALRRALDDNDHREMRRILVTLVEGYKSSDGFGQDVDVTSRNTSATSGFLN